MQIHVQHHKSKCCTQTQPPSLTTSMDIEHIQAFVDTPGTAAWHSPHFSDNTTYVVALQQTLVTSCTFNQCDAFTLLPLHHTSFQYWIPDTLVPEAEQTASPQNKQVQRLPMKSSNDTVKDRTCMQWNMCY